jgi:hypothetical protein
MKKERLFPFWTDLERVNAVMQTRIASNLRLTLVSIEIYTIYGFLLTMNVEATSLNELIERPGRGWMRAAIIDQEGGRYSSMLAMIPGTVYNNVFRGRSVMICMPQLSEQTRDLTITIDSIEWEYTDGDENQPSSVEIKGPWMFTITL